MKEFVMLEVVGMKDGKWWICPEALCVELFGFENDTPKDGHALPYTSGYRVGKSSVGKWSRLVGVEGSKLGGV